MLIKLGNAAISLSPLYKLCNVHRRQDQFSFGAGSFPSTESAGFQMAINFTTLCNLVQSHASSFISPFSSFYYLFVFSAFISVILWCPPPPNFKAFTLRYHILSFFLKSQTMTAPVVVLANYLRLLDSQHLHQLLSVSSIY